jgi:hypothetical protein
MMIAPPARRLGRRRIGLSLPEAEYLGHNAAYARQHLKIFPFRKPLQDRQYFSRGDFGDLPAAEKRKQVIVHSVVRLYAVGLAGDFLSRASDHSRATSRNDVTPKFSGIPALSFFLSAFLRFRAS